jgi:hypothetical protein
MKGRINHANLTAGLAMEGSRIAFLRMRVFLKSPVLENGTPGSVRGASGNRRPYRDDGQSLRNAILDSPPVCAQCLRGHTWIDPALSASIYQNQVS